MSPIRRKGLASVLCLYVKVKEEKIHPVELRSYVMFDPQLLRCVWSIDKSVQVRDNKFQRVIFKI